MSKPIDIIAEAIHDAECGCGQTEAVAFSTAATAANALTDDRIVDNAAQELAGGLLPAGVVIPTNADRRTIALMVLRSVGGK